MKKLGAISLAIIGFIIIAFTLLVFFLMDIERITVNILALSFLLLSEVALFAGLIGIQFLGSSHNKIFIRASVTSTLSLYFLVTLVSMLFAGSFKEDINPFILIQAAIISLVAIALVATFAWSAAIAKRNEADVTKVGTTEPKRGGF